MGIQQVVNCRTTTQREADCTTIFYNVANVPCIECFKIFEKKLFVGNLIYKIHQFRRRALPFFDLFRRCKKWKFAVDQAVENDQSLVEIENKHFPWARGFQSLTISLYVWRISACQLALRRESLPANGDTSHPLCVFPGKAGTSTSRQHGADPIPGSGLGWGWFPLAFRGFPVRAGGSFLVCGQLIESRREQKDGVGMGDRLDGASPWNVGDGHNKHIHVTPIFMLHMTA